MPRFSPAPIQQYRGTHGALRTYVGPEGELVMDTTQGRVVVMDGETAGGIPLARLDEITGATFVRTDGAVELDGTAGRSIRYYITVDGSATIPEGVSAPYWVWNYIVDDEETNFTLQFLRATDGSIYNREGSEPEGSGSDWSEWARIGGGGETGDYVTLDTEQTITGTKYFEKSYPDGSNVYSGMGLMTTVPADELPAKAEYPGIWVTDSEGNRIGKFEYSLLANGARYMQLCVTPPGNGGTSGQSYLRFGYEEDGSQTFKVGTMTVGSSSTPIYLNSGTPTACSVSDIAVQMVAATPNCYRRSELMTPNQTSITIHPTQVNINGAGYISTTDVTLQLSDALSASNRAGTDMYVYACEPSSGTVPTFVLSANSTVPSGYTADTSRKIGGFHCLCAAVGTISGHTLSGYAQGDILPLSVWDLNHRAVSENEGMVWIEAAGAWVDIYMSSYSGSQLVSEYGGSTVTGSAGGKKMHGEMFVEELGLVKKRLIWRDEFLVFAKGSNEGTNISGSSNPGTAGGHSDTAGRRMVSNYGVEDCCGVWYQWTGDCYPFENPDVQDSTYQTLAQALYKGTMLRGNWYASSLRWDLYQAAEEYGGTEPGNPPSSNQAGYSRIHHQDIDGDSRYGDMYGCLGRALVGCNWGSGSRCGSRSVLLNGLSSCVASARGGRGAARARAVGAN